MPEPKIAVVIPVGPEAHHARWLTECLKTVVAQTVLPSDIVIVDDMHGLDLDIFEWPNEFVHIYHPPWRLGVAHAFNAGSSIAFQRGADLALMLGADDTIEERVVESIAKTYKREQRREGYYFCEVFYSDGRRQTAPCNCAAWTPELFKRTGGFSVESASGACDAAYISQLLVHDKRALIQVPGNPAGRFMHRVHDQQQTKNQPPGIIGIRNWLTLGYMPTRWGRYG